MIQPAPFVSNSNAVVAALAWLERAMLGSVAIAIAVIAVASIGFMMLTGRIDVRRAGSVVLGCFIIFGASIIASGMRNAASGLGGQQSADALPPQAALPPAPPAYPQAPPQPYDPYAGASMPSH